MTAFTSGPRFTIIWAVCMGSVSIHFVLSGIEFHCYLAVSVRAVVLRRGVLSLRLVLLFATPSPVLRGLLGLPRVCCARSVVASVAWVPASLKSPFSFAAWFPLQLTYCRLLCGHFVSFLHSLRSCLWWSAEICSILVQCTHLGLRLQLRVECVSSWQLRHTLILLVSM